MLLDLHANPGDLTPIEFAQKVAAAGLDAVVVTRTNRADGLDPYLDALDAEEIDGYVGVELALEKGLLVYLPKEENEAFFDADWTNQGRLWTLDALNDRVDELNGAVIAAHPYCRDAESVLGDQVYRLPKLTAMTTRIGRGRQTWDKLADAAAAKKNVASIGSSGGHVDFLGSAATVFDETVESQEDLVVALNEKRCLLIEMDDPNHPRDRSTPQRRENRSNDRGRDGRGRDGRGRGDQNGRGGRRDGRGRGDRNRGPRRD